VGERVAGYAAPDNQPWVWEIDFFEILRHGPPNQVRRGVGTGTSYVVVQKTACGDENDTNRLRDEIDIGVTLLQRLREFGRVGDRYPPELSRLIGSDDSNSNPFLLVTSLSQTARTLAEARRPLAPDELEQFAIGLFTGLYWLGLAEVVHRDLTPSNILWDGGRVQIIDFSHATFAGAMWDRVKAPPWDLLDDTTQPLVEPYDDLRRAGFLILYAATTTPPEDLLSFYKDRWPLHRRYDEVSRWLGRLLDDPSPENNRRPRAEDVLERLGVPIPVLPTRYDPRMAQGREQFGSIKAAKEARRNRRQARVEPPERRDRSGLPRLKLPRKIELYILLAGLGAVALLGVTFIVMFILPKS
jgi:serine/threonine protein kinase